MAQKRERKRKRIEVRSDAVVYICGKKINKIQTSSRKKSEKATLLDYFSGTG